MASKASRWYEVDGAQALVYDAPYRSASQSVSIVSKDQLRWYAAHFLLRKSWGERPGSANQDPFRDQVWST